MDSCCEYYVLQMKLTNGIWKDTEYSSKIFAEVELMVNNFFGIETRIQQRLIDADRKLKKKVPRCC